MAVSAPNPFAFAADLLYPEGGARLNKYVPHKPHPPQMEFLKLDCLEALYGGAAGGGKSDALLMAALQYADVPGYSAIILRRLSPDLHGADGLVPRSKEWLGPVLGLRAYNGERMVWTFPSGATLRFGHAQYEDDILKYQGHAYQFVGWDELTHFTERQYRYLFSRLRKLSTGAASHIPLRVRSASNPGGPGHEWVKRRLVDKVPDPLDPEDTPDKVAARVFVPAKLVDNPSIDQESYRASLAALEPEERAQLLDGDWDARMPGDWYFRDLAGVQSLGSELEELLAQNRVVANNVVNLRFDHLKALESMPAPSGGRLNLGVDWGQSTHALLGWPLEGGGVFVAREYVSYGEEPGEKTLKMLRLNEWGLPWDRVFFDAAGVQSQKTFNATAERKLGTARPTAKAIPFGAQAPRTARTALKSYKGVGCAYLRRLARRASEGHATQVLAISPKCPVLLRQMRQLQNDPEDPVGAWQKEDDQHGPDALVALMATSAIRHRVAVDEESRRVAAV